jgi:hypothetical protein
VRDADVVAEEAWELVVEGRRVLGNVCVETTPDFR